MLTKPGNEINLNIPLPKPSPDASKIPSPDASSKPPKTPAKPDSSELTPSDSAVVSKTLRLEIQLSRRRVVLYDGESMIKSYPIAVGRPGWETPKGTYKVLQKIKNPAWIHPLQKGVVIPGGDPENPLGRYWIGFWTNGKNWIGFHGTPNPESVGKAASHGCIRMLNSDVEDLFQRVSLGTPVKVVK
jgi:lipoprotein-anchoring transpeptidase ErfK/SrfK